jgi:hypothetical protein
MRWITVGEIKNWPNKNSRHCQEVLPELIRRLILSSTVNCLNELDFPSGDGIATGGWDGHLKTSIKTPFFSDGHSGWEIGSNKSAKSKADDDYLKRTANPLNLVPKDTTFIFVTPRSWPEKNKWQQEKKKMGIWRDVRVINADMLYQWIDTAPAVARWLAREIGNVTSDGIRDLEDVWNEWIAGTEPQITPELVVGGRDKEVTEIQKWIADDPQILGVQGDHPEEASAFLYASIATLPELDKTKALARCLVVENSNELRQLTQHFQNPLIIVAPAECIDAARGAVSKGHHIFICMNAMATGLRGSLRLSRPRKEAVENILHRNGLTSDEAKRKSRDSGRSIPVLRRNLFQTEIVKTPVWATFDLAQILIPALFANTWDENKDGDRQVIELLSGLSYEKFTKKISYFLSVEDSPVRKIGSVWMIKSPLDAWFILAQYLTQDQLSLYKKALLAVLTKTDPKYDLEAEKRWAAAIYGKASPYSEWLHSGLVESLVLLAVFGDRSPRIAQTQSFANYIVSEIFTKGGKWESWATIKDATPLLAEAAPDSFVDAVEKTIKEKPDVFKKLMGDDTSGIFGECRHSGLLWALENMAWSSRFFMKAVIALAELASIDTGGNWNNRAINSLKEIFLPRFPQTYATTEERLGAMDLLIKKYPKIVWKFTQGYFRSGTISESHRFRWRDAGGVRRGLEPEDGSVTQKYLIGLLPKLRDLAVNKENIVSSTDEFIRLSDDTQDHIIKALERTEIKSFTKEERKELFRCIREALNWIIGFGDKEIKNKIPELEKIYKKFTPTDIIDRVEWLLNNSWPNLPKQNADKQTVIKKAQKQAARELLDNASMGKIIKFAKSIQYQGILGYSLASAAQNQKEDSKILDAFLKYTKEMPILIKNYAIGRVEIAGEGWIDKQIKRLKIKKSYSPEKCALLHFGLPESAKNWAKIEKYGKKEESAYWKQASGYLQDDKGLDSKIAVEKLLNAGRSDVALTIAGEQNASISSALLQRLLNEFLEFNKRSIGTMSEYHIGHVFRQLYERNELSTEELAKLEWPFAVLFEEIKQYTSRPMAIHRSLQSDSHLFAQLVKYIYKRDDNKPNKDNTMSEEMAEKIATVAHKVLDSWYLIPGANDDGSIDEEKLTKWIEDVRRFCNKTKHTTGGDIQIGFMLAHAPADPDGVWPHISIRNVIEKLSNPTIERHIEIEIYNSRGVVSRNPSDGGRQEKDLAGKYNEMSRATNIKWPRTSSMLRSLAESYERDAQREDLDSDLRELRWN